ncbi:MAG: AMP-binding protein, partial [Actinomycetota bacterium]|nr:AMP-binding protein [Actinomycetota bacterium]
MAIGVSYAHGTGETPLLGQTIGDNLAATAARLPDHEALVEVASGRRWTYRQLLGWSREVAAGLLARGVRPGDRVGIWSPNCAEWVALQYATAMIGAILVNVNPAYRTTELDYVARQSGLSILVSATAVRSSDYRAMAEQVAPGLPALREVVYIGEPSWDHLVADGTGVEPGELDRIGAGLGFDDPINIQYTSGTTGFPKGATL